MDDSRVNSFTTTGWKLAVTKERYPYAAIDALDYFTEAEVPNADSFWCLAACIVAQLR